MCVVVPLKNFIMNYCMSDMYDIAHGVSGGYAVPPGGEYCMYGGEGPGFTHCEPQPLHHHPPSMEQAWPPSQPYGCPFTGGNPVFKSELCSMEVPLSHYHQPDYYSDGRPDFSQMQWMQGPHKKGIASSRRSIEVCCWLPKFCLFFFWACNWHVLGGWLYASISCVVV